MMTAEVTTALIQDGGKTSGIIAGITIMYVCISILISLVP